ncbi:hypothetical protein [Nisaea sediminum]|uniref:hypothetical protein n=1 Tax=Nisaea sediminum TaxID=2775867 RepID=UPI00186761CC|nr:hypothetical protein [Nisaea sediminum]
MDIPAPFLLTAHIVFGALSLAAAAFAVAAPKGRRLHRIAGRIYVLAMTGVFVSAIMLSLRSNDLFLMVVGIFSYYMVLSGYRALYLKQPAASADLRFRPGALDKGAAQFTLIACSGLAAYGAVYWYTDLAPVLMVLGSIGALMALLDLRRFKSTRVEPTRWFFTHMIRMLGGTIASVTAFLVTNAEMLPPLARWLAPTLAGTVVITLWVFWYKRKFASGSAPETVADVRIGEYENDD